MQRLPALLVVIVLGLTGCGGDAEPVIDPGDGGTYTADISAADFVTAIDNQWLPFTPGSRWVYEGVEGDEVERIEVVVLAETRDIQGITATIVRDTVTVGGELIEDTFDWYAQDTAGNVWYLGEDSKEYENGEVASTAGSWEHGVDGALAGIIMWADPMVGRAYRQEYYQGEAEDLAEVDRRGGTVTVRAGTFNDVIVIKEWNPLEPDVVEEKTVAAAVGVIKEEKVRGGSEVVELIEYSTG